MTSDQQTVDELLNPQQTLFEKAIEEMGDKLSIDDSPETGPWDEFVPKVFGWTSFGDRHRRLWEWAWEIEYSLPQRPFIGIWPRGGGKSATAEALVCALGARRETKYVLYVCATQDQADAHVGEIMQMLNNDYLDEHDPLLTERALNKYGQAVAWRRDRLSTASGLTVEGLGLDVQARGIKFGDRRPDLIILDDLDSEDDSMLQTDSKEKKLTRKILQTGTSKTKVLGVQNQIIDHGIFSRIRDGEADYLLDAEISAEPAIENMEYERVESDNGHKYVINRGEPTWEGQSVEDCEQIMNRVGPTQFMIECQHRVAKENEGMFSHVDFRRCSQSEVPWSEIERIVGWCDPAITNNDKSDCQAIQFDAYGPDFENRNRNVVYRLFSYEQQDSPRKMMKRALSKAVELGAEKVGVETDQGGNTWRDTFESAWRDLTEDPAYQDITPHTHKPAFDQDKASRGYGSKRSRGQQMLSDYERGDIVHVRGTHQTLESALNRFDPPNGKPFDLVDSNFWTWNDLTTTVNFTVV